MIRYIHIGDQITEGDTDFAWYDTIPDRFISFAGQQVFDSWKDFEEWYRLEPTPHSDLERFKSLYREPPCE